MDGMGTLMVLNIFRYLVLNIEKHNLLFIF